MYWDNSNKPIDRPRLLFDSQTAGHTGHVNELNSLMEKVKEPILLLSKIWWLIS